MPVQKKFSDFDTAGSFDDMKFFVGYTSGGNNYKFTPAQLITYVLAQTRKQITVGSDGATLTDAFFSNPISKIITNGQAYQIGIDFTQSGTTLTGLTISFTAGQKLIAEQ